MDEEEEVRKRIIREMGRKGGLAARGSAPERLAKARRAKAVNRFWASLSKIAQFWKRKN